MSPLTTVTALRATALAVWTIVALLRGAELWRGRLPWPVPFTAAVQAAVLVTLLAVFAACMWSNMREAPVESHSKAHVARLIAQAIVGLAVHTDLLYVVAGQAALVLDRRSSMIWLGAQTLALIAWATMAWRAGHFLTLAALDDIASPAAFSITLASLLTWQTLAFCVGWLAANEARHRRAFERVNAALRLAQDELARRSRLAERLRIARDLHDTLGHRLVAMNLQLDLARRVDAARREAHVELASQLGRDALAEVRDVVSELREGSAIDLPAALASMQTVAPTPRIQATWQLDPSELLPILAHVVLRCAQEAWSNSVRHGAAGNFWLTLDGTADSPRLAMRDDGMGCELIWVGNGLKGMRERVESVGGTLAMRSARGQGFTIDIRLGAGNEP